MTQFFEFTRDDKTIVTIEYSASNYDPGNSYGPPENCDPGSGPDIEIENVFSDVAKNIQLSDAEAERAHEEIIEKWEPDDSGDYD